MGILHEKEKRAVSQIISTLQEIDVYNVVNEDAKMLVDWKFVQLIQNEYEVGEKLAREWLDKALKMNSESHEAMFKQELMVRKQKFASELTSNLIDKPNNSTFLNTQKEAISTLI